MADLPTDTPTQILASILLLSGHIIQNIDLSGNCKSLDPEGWINLHADRAEILGIGPDDIRDFEEDALDKALIEHG